MSNIIATQNIPIIHDLVFIFNSSGGKFKKQYGKLKNFQMKVFTCIESV